MTTDKNSSIVRVFSFQICEKLNSGKWTSVYDDVQKSMYAYGEGNWVGYDNVDTLTIRVCLIVQRHSRMRKRLL
jgi:hypothetical protein